MLFPAVGLHREGIEVLFGSWHDITSAEEKCLAAFSEAEVMAE